jgi:pSer/pThr/pTyr-binding forkhead associated (FHA) protein
MHAEPNLRLETLQIVGALAAFTVLALPRGWAHKAQDDGLTTPAVELRVEQADGVRSVRLPLPVVIGRGREATLKPADAQVSRTHARIEMMDGKLFLHDLGSRNGTLLNARPIDAPAALREGDEIDVGDTRIVVGGVGVWK